MTQNLTTKSSGYLFSWTFDNVVIALFSREYIFDLTLIAQIPWLMFFLVEKVLDQKKKKDLTVI